VVRSHAKINLGLYIGGPRPDGFHGLATVYQTLALHEPLTVTARPSAATRITLRSNDARVPTDERNTAWKMVALALEALGQNAEVEIFIDKQLPVQGGMGAGSANAAAALVGLERELGIDPAASLTVKGTAAAPTSWAAERLKIGAKVGSDVPLFLVGGASLGLDRGQEVVPLPDFAPIWCVVALPEVGVSTPQAFRDWDGLCAADGLTLAASTDKLNLLSRAYSCAFSGSFPPSAAEASSSGVLPRALYVDGKDLADPSGVVLVRTGICRWIENDFERVVFRQQPSLCALKHILTAEGTPERALVAMLSGSGSALFGLYPARKDAEVIQQRLADAGVRSVLTYTLPRADYWQQMLLETTVDSRA